MTRLLAALVLLALTSSLGAVEEVVVYMYSEYIDPELVGAFEAQTGMRCRIDVYESSEEMFAKVSQAGGDSQYDVLVVSDVIVPALVKSRLVRELDRSLIPNATNVDRAFTDPPFDPGSKFSLPYQWGTIGLMYRKDKIPVPPEEASWAAVFDTPHQPGAFVLMDSLRDTLGIALRYLGHDMNSTDPAHLRAATDLLLRAKSSALCKGFEGGVGGKNKVLAGEADLAVVYNGDAIRGINEEDKRDTLAFVVPREGSVIWTDVMVITTRAPNAAGGHRFIDFILEAKNGAQLSNFNRYPSPNAASLPMILEEDRVNPEIYPSPQRMSKLAYLHDLGAATRLYDEAWTAVKSRQLRIEVASPASPATPVTPPGSSYTLLIVGGVLVLTVLLVIALRTRRGA